uniref:transglutaminase domain-containing protein n=1 Tax=Acetatifactor sp. TaxID=1872090 RepID=UPI004056F886
MKKRTFKSISILLCIIMTCSLCGCADTDILTEVLETAFLETDSGREITTSEEGRQVELSDEANIDNETKEEDIIPNQLYENASCFAYENLSESQQLWYDEIAESLGCMRENTRLDKSGIDNGLDESDIDKIFQCVLTDHPELFYVEGYTYTKYNRGDEIVAIEFAGTFSMEASQVLSRKAQIEQRAQNFLAGAVGLADDYSKVKYVYDSIICNTEYDLTAPDNQNIYSVFVNGKSVCQGYAKAVQYLLERMGVECTLVQGTVDTGEGHAWNLVKVNGSYYYVDATWGDASYLPREDESTSAYVPEINYDYLCVTTEQLLRTHVLGSYVPMPACVDEKDNYYVREGALFTTYDKEQMQALFDKFMMENRQDVTVKCSDVKTFHQIMAALIQEQEIFEYLADGSNTIAYTHNEKQLSMTFWVTNE